MFPTIRLTIINNQIIRLTLSIITLTNINNKTDYYQ